MVYHIIDIPQNTPEWKAFRKDKIGASDIPAITGSSPWMNQYDLWKIKNDLSDIYETEAMKKGKEKEPEIIQALNSEVGLSFKPIVLQRKDTLWAITSLDGMSEDKASICEVKCLGDRSFEKIQKSGIPIYYQEQMLWQMFVSGLSSCIFFAWCNGKTYLETFEYSERRLKNLYLKAEEFYEKYILGASIPEEEDITPLYIDDPLFLQVENEYHEVDLQIKQLEKQLKEKRSKLFSFYEGEHIRGNLLKISSYERKGSFSERMLESAGLNPDDFRSPTTKVDKISFLSA